MMLSERRHPPITYFQPITETIGKPFTMSTSTSKPEDRVRICQQPGGIVRVGQPFPTPLVVESNLADGFFFIAVLSDAQGTPISPEYMQLGGHPAVNGDGGESENGDGGDSKRKRSSSSKQARVEHAEFTDITIPSKGTFTITVQAMQIDNQKNSVLVAVQTTEAFEVV